MFILGLNAYHADSSAAIFKDGVLIAATEEERFRRVKHWAGFPDQAIKFCLHEAGISLDDLHSIAIGRDPKAKLFTKILFAASHPGIGMNAIRNRMQNAKKISSIPEEFLRIFPGSDKENIEHKLRYIEHHRAHLASAFFASPFREAALLSIDGSGDFTTTMLGHGMDTSMEIYDSIDFPHSIGIFYSAFTQFLGFPHYGDEYKIMGLAPYGKPVYVDKLRHIVKLLNNGLFKLDLRYFTATKGNIISYGDDHIPVVDKLFSKKLVEEMGPARNGKDPITQFHMDIAASVQRYTEEIIFHLLHGLYERNKLESVCIAGGVAQNSVANGKIKSNTPFKNVYIPSAGHDAGIAMGSALYVYHQLMHEERMPAIWSAYTGSRYDNSQIESMLKSANLRYTSYSDEQLYEIVSERLVNGGVIGWFNGRAEFGPRALGARSILADPRRKDAKELLNSKVKRRESFRPFAPSILKDYVGEYFNVIDDVPFMEKVFPVRIDKQELIPAVTHVDGTGRLQTVDEATNPRYYRLIKRFYEKSGVPILLNTSFNENEPIVNSPKEALDCFLRTQMDMLVLENIVIERDQLTE
ncbi:MAG: carbamoyltransferase [Saprospiraceae bacterium]|uniref:Carbamoyltransferase n=1 Tax=Candidatus Opimibacter skivensis TaxID=2982028 RepID=A0A9D7SZ54_9BACT|nr:carbamoyltransferase [Candidatus Opimibacter skivensis]